MYRKKEKNEIDLYREKRKTKKIKCEIKKIIIIKKRGSLKIILYQIVRKNEKQLYR